eukprot:scaffold175098_cov35-Prasinocladus_malaysianus.AAC.1
MEPTAIVLRARSRLNIAIVRISFGSRAWDLCELVARSSDQTNYFAYNTGALVRFAATRSLLLSVSKAAANLQGRE